MDSVFNRWSGNIHVYSKALPSWRLGTTVSVRNEWEHWEWLANGGDYVQIFIAKNLSNDIVLILVSVVDVRVGLRLTTRKDKSATRIIIICSSLDGDITKFWDEPLLLLYSSDAFRLHSDLGHSDISPTEPLDNT